MGNKFLFDVLSRFFNLEKSLRIGKKKMFIFHIRYEIENKEKQLKIHILIQIPDKKLNNPLHGPLFTACNNPFLLWLH